MRIRLSVVLYILAVTVAFGQHTEKRGWCPTDCNANDEHPNYTMVRNYLADSTLMSNIDMDDIHTYPLRIGIVLDTSGRERIPVYLKSINNTLAILNSAFSSANLFFELTSIDTLYSDNNISELSSNGYSPYYDFSKNNDLKDTLSLYLFNYDKELCKIDNGIISCARTGGFSFILSEYTNNVVLSNFELDNHKVVVHEFGHFFGLYHTFETNRYGKEMISGQNYQSAGDRICDTPADPPPIFEVYVNYSTCRMTGNFDIMEGLSYDPLIHNYMSYYKPCYLKEYAFTEEQNLMIRLASTLPMRSKLRIHK